MQAKLSKKIDINVPVRVMITALICIVVAFPVYWMLVTSITPEVDTFSASPKIIPNAFDQTGYRNLFKQGSIFLWIKNSAIIALSTSFLVVCIASLSAYSLSRFAYRGKKYILILMLLTQMLPEALLILPIYMMYKEIGFLNHYHGLILVDVAFQLPVGTWIIKNYFDTIPKELDESARMDGCNNFRIFVFILMPVIIPAMAATAIIVFFEAWNEYLFASTMNTKNSLWVTSVGLASFIGMYTAPVTQIMAGSILFSIPCLIIYVFFQKQIVSGLTQGSVKG